MSPGTASGAAPMSRATVTRGVARIPSGSLSATPTRTLPTSTPSRLPRNTGFVTPASLSGGLADRLLHRCEQDIQLVSGHPAALREIGVAATATGERALDQIRGGQATTLRCSVHGYDQ